MRIQLIAGSVLAAALAFSACTEKPAPEPQAPATAVSAPPTMRGMAGMGNAATAMMNEMETHLNQMTASADTLKVTLPAHRQMVANMLSQFGREMKQMNMKADATWDALSDSVRADLTRMPDLGPDDLKAMMEAHAARVRRLMEKHRGMMKM